MKLSFPQKTREVTVTLKEGLLKTLDFSSTKRIAIIADEAVKEAVALPLLEKVQGEKGLFTFPSGEGSKSRSEKERLENALLEAGYGRDTLIIAVGGGVAIDLAGFVAATFCRGVSWIGVPTSLLSMIDAAIGGKTAVNTPYGKNLIGIVHQPEAIWIDPSLLKSLPEKPFREGLAEAIKHAALFSDHLFKVMETERKALLNRDMKLLESLIEENCLIKGAIVEEDPFETAKRRLLNFGHTIGHALENLSHFTLSHGECVARGMVEESRYFVKAGLMDPEAFHRLETLIKSYEFPTDCAGFSKSALWVAMTHDKKAKKGLPRFSGIHAIGEPLTFDGAYCIAVDPSLL